MSSSIRFVMIGGFLGSGKTTLIANLARRYQSEGKHVCVVTNDQAAGLVDTHHLRSQGLSVSEVAGSCFCCNFHGLTEAINSFENVQKPDVILAEPVGSCTDLIATIAVPMMEQMNEKFVHSPYAVTLKPSHGLRILTGEGKRGFSDKAEYIFRKQLEEADLILINRIDELSDNDQERLRTCLRDQYPDKQVLAISAKTGQNLDQLKEALGESVLVREQFMDVDYEIYAAGEAELGWLNATVDLAFEAPVAVDAVAIDVVDLIRSKLETANAEPAHLKVLCSTGDAVAVANVVSSEVPTMLSVPANQSGRQMTLIVNARVNLGPESLEPAVRRSIEKVADKHAGKATVRSLECFRPSPPVPTFRVGV